MSEASVGDGTKLGSAYLDAVSYLGPNRTQEMKRNIEKKAGDDCICVFFIITIFTPLRVEIMSHHSNVYSLRRAIPRGGLTSHSGMSCSASLGWRPNLTSFSTVTYDQNPSTSLSNNFNIYSTKINVAA